MILVLVVRRERTAPLTLKISSEVERPPAALLQKDPQQKQSNTSNTFSFIFKSKWHSLTLVADRE